MNTAGNSRFRPLESTDAALLAAMHSACFAEAMSPSGASLLLGVRTTWGALAYRLEGQTAEPVGYCVVRGMDEECEVLDFGILPDFQRKGWGRALLREVVSNARRHGIDRLFLEVADDNVAGRALYSGAGFVTVGQRPGYYRRSPNSRVDALLMCLNLKNGRVN